MFIARLRKTLGEKLFGSSVVEIIKQMEPFLNRKGLILDLGAGTCLYTKLLRDRGFNVKAIDLKNISYYPEIHVEIYDGQRLPYEDNHFDVCLLRSVLHHTPNPQAVLKEVSRVSKKLIVYENVITNIFQRYYTYLIDCIMNKELIQPHTNKKDKEWQALFNKLKLKLVKTIDEKAWIYLQNKIYFLSKI